MSFDPVPWFVGGGAEHSPDVSRLLAYAATGGTAGIIAPTDLLPTTTPAPTGNVRLMPGACVIPNTYAGVSQQSYMARASSVTDVPVPATGSAGGRHDLLVIRVDDPQFGGTVPTDRTVGPYVRAELISNVPAGTVALPSYVTFPALVIARIDLPANTATVTSNLITDLRHVAQPRRERSLLTKQPVGNQSLNTSGDTVFTPFPSEASRTIDIPSWATQAVIKGDLSGVYASLGQAQGYLRMRLGSLLGDGVFYDVDIPSGAGRSRFTFTTGDTFTIPPAMRGTTVQIEVQGSRRAGMTSTLNSTPQSFVAIDVEFSERASAA